MTTLSFGEGKPRGLILAGVHGDEYEPILAVHRLARMLPTLSLRGSVQLVPLVNESAFARRARCGEDGKDLARTCPGRADGSPTEQIAHEVSGLIRGADFLIDLHTGGVALQVAPLAGYTMHPDAAVLEKQRAMAQAFDLPLIWGSSPALNGRTLSVARDANVPAIYAEWGGGAPLNAQGVDAYVEGCLRALALWNIIDHAGQPSRVRHVVEESHDTSGELLLMHRAPFDGFFDCHVALNQNVRAGEVIGTVFEPQGMREAKVPAEQNGIVICLRSLAAVAQGDSLAMILEIPDEQ
jgi:predicted deacylase